MINVEKDLYPFVERFLIEKKNCFNDYVGNELHMGSDKRMRADIYGYSNNKDSKLIYLLEGKHYLDARKNFSKVLCEALPLLEYADHVYIFGISSNDFEKQNKKYFEICKLLGIGILILDEYGEINEILVAKRNQLDEFDRKEVLFRIFLKGVKSPTANLIFQAVCEYIKLNRLENNCVQFIEVYQELFSKEEYKESLDHIFNSNFVLTDIGMRNAFEKEFGNSEFVKIQPMSRKVDDYICITQKGRELIRKSILIIE
ncbi:MAG: hypothetical protein CVV28_02920 [Methanobacteriales archaeon HGW-Methanobacteriales-1]|jgi:hypothetical protein|nr:MAG: hypothetical protein CVV28_02920 [Methanobacteriales archaeon HGW-Methanobacteriales-1]